MTVWNHTRKGRIEGVIVKATDEWVDIQVSGSQDLRSGKPGSTIPVEDAEIITVRKSMLTEIPAYEIPAHVKPKEPDPR